MADDLILDQFRLENTVIYNKTTSFVSLLSIDLDIFNHSTVPIKNLAKTSNLRKKVSFLTFLNSYPNGLDLLSTVKKMYGIYIKYNT